MVMVSVMAAQMAGVEIGAALDALCEAFLEAGRECAARGEHLAASHYELAAYDVVRSREKARGRGARVEDGEI